MCKLYNVSFFLPYYPINCYRYAQSILATIGTTLYINLKINYMFYTYRTITAIYIYML